MRILPVNNFYNTFNIKKKSSQSVNINNSNKDFSLSSYPSNYYLSFSSSRVDKGLPRFYAFNKDKMPVTVREYVESLSSADKALETPISAQYNAFDLLECCSSIDDVKCAYPDEPLFESLKNLEDTKPSRGFLCDAKLLKNDIEASGESVVLDEQSLTVYLLKKIFLEAKTVKEINEDIDADVHPMLRNEDKNYITHSTLRALGIQMPNTEYLNSLRYTREGYSDKVGQVISDNWANLSEEERLNRISLFQNSRKPLTPEKAAELREKRAEIMRRRWQEMSPEEKADYIEKMKAGSDVDKVVMVHAWNSCDDVREKLSEFFIKNNFYNPGSIIYSDNEFSGQMKKLMISFWNQNPDCAEKLGFAIKEAYKDIEKAKDNGTYDDFKILIYQKQKDAKYEMKVKRSAKKEELKANKNALDAFKTAYSSKFFFLPKDFLDCYYENIAKMPKEQLLVWAKKFQDKPLTSQEQVLLKQSHSFIIDNPEYLKKRDAVNAAMMSVLINSLTTDSKADIGAITYSDFRSLSSILIHLFTNSLAVSVDTQIGTRTLKFARKPKPKDIREKYENFSRPMSKKEAIVLSEALLDGCVVSDEQRNIVVQNLSERCHVYADLLKSGFNEHVKIFLLTNLQNDFSHIDNFGKKLRYDITVK